MSETVMKRICSNCNTEMELAVKSYPMGSAFIKNRFHVDICRCPICQKVELFAAESDMVTCPVCGATHHVNERCVTCALNAAFDGKKREAAAFQAVQKAEGAEGEETETLVERVRHNYEAEKQQVVDSYLAVCPICGMYHAINESCTQCALDKEFKAMKAGGIQAPAVSEKKEAALKETGVGQIEAGFLAKPEMSAVEELSAIRYAASPKEIDEDIEKVEKTCNPQQKAD